MEAQIRSTLTRQNAEAPYHYGRALIESIVVLSVEEACGLNRIVHTTVPRVGEVEDAIREARLL